MKRSGRIWAVAGGLIAVWAVLGFLFASSPSIDWLPRWVISASVLAPLAWICIYTVQGVFGPGKWWRSDLGTNMVWLETAVVFTNGMLLWAQVFNHGSIDSPLTAWLYLGGLLAGVVIITWRSVIWLRTYRHGSPLARRCAELELQVAELQHQIGMAGDGTPA